MYYTYKELLMEQHRTVNIPKIDMEAFVRLILKFDFEVLIK